jgi:AraC-like DNA-binding protein
VSVPRLLWQDLAATGAYHAALFGSRLLPRTEIHTHDFYEMMYVLAGCGTHIVNNQTLSLRTSDLIFVRPDDCHAIAARPGTDLQFVNVAFPKEAWLAFCTLADVSNDALSERPLPPTVRIPAERRDECGRVFRRALLSFQQGARLELCGFWALSVPFLIQPLDPHNEDEAELPAWLRLACWAIRDEDSLRIGLPRFVELSGVSSAHLSRTLKAYRGQTPTEFVNDLRLERAALLLTTTRDEIGEIAADCGFRTLGYFYRLFRERYGQSPRVYRLRAPRAIAPLGSPGRGRP